jgi:phosphatidylserine/phosphatidylglycerophosphate/cardiolipin synthase-like enzyme
MQRWLGGGQHVKIQVSEEGEAIFGSSNLSRSSYEGWNEYSVALRGPVARTLLESYRELGGIVEETHLRQLADVVAAGTADLVLDYWLCNPNHFQGVAGPLGWRGPNIVTDRLIERIAGARRSIWITSFYFKPVEPLLAALVAAAKRGVQVEVHHSHREALPATDLAWIAAAAHYDRLMAAGVRIYENRHGEHSKIVLIDEAWVAFGSYNFEHAAHDRLAEAMLTSSDARATSPAAAIFAELRHDPDNLVVTREVLAEWPARLKARRRLFGPFKRWM